MTRIHELDPGPPCMTIRTFSNQEPSIILPTQKLLFAVIAACSIVSALWILITWILGSERLIILAGPVGACIVLTTSSLGVLVMNPWKSREISMWGTMWLAATVLRLLLTPSLTFLLYSATTFQGPALGLAVVSSYFAALMAEWVVLERHISKILPV